MANSLKIATFNVENLFKRARVFNFSERKDGDKILAKIDELRLELDKKAYDGERIFELYDKLKKFIEVTEVRGKLFKRNRQFEVVGVKAAGKDDWGGFITFNKADFREITRKNTAKVVNSVNADIISLIEVEDKTTLDAFNSQLITRKYKFSMLIDAYDPRGIDVSLLSRLEMCNIRTHMSEKVGRSPIFSRDCLEVEIKVADNDFIYLFINHFKSQGYGTSKENDAKRLRQTQRVADIIVNERTLDLKNDKVVILGDFNATRDNKSLSPLIDLKGLKDVLELQFPNPDDRWTYHWDKNQQIDYILVSEPLQNAFKQAGIERRGIYNLAKYSNGQEIAWPDVQEHGVTASASDHGAVWAQFDL